MTAPLRTLTLTLEPAPLMALNELMRAHHRVYQAHVKQMAGCLWQALQKQEIRTATPSWVPLRYVEIAVVLRHPGLYDIDNKVAACKSVLDALKQPHATKNPHGLGVIWDDSDGEHGNPGFIRRLDVRQIRGTPALCIEIMEVSG